MTITLNGEPRSVASGSLVDLLHAENVKDISVVSIQINGEFLPSASVAGHQLNDKDEVDFLYFLGGGAAL